MQSQTAQTESLITVPVSSTAGMARPSAVVRVVETTADFDALQEQWDQLFDQNGFSVFQSFSWQRTWWKHYGEGNPDMRLNILLVYEGGRVVGIAPFFVEVLRVYGLLRIRRMGLIGRGQSDYQDFLVAEGCDQVSLDAVAGHIAKHRGAFDIVVIEDFSDRSPRNIVWSEALRKVGLNVEREVTDYCPRVVFKPTWEESLAAIPCNNNRKMEKFRRQIASKFKGEVEFTDEKSSFQDDFQDFARLHQQRWKRSGWPGLFEDPKFERFFRDALEQQKQRGKLVLAFFRIEGDRRLAIVGFKHRDEFQYYLSGLGDPGKTAHHSPGLVLHTHSMEYLFHQGFHVYDFLRGSESYKMDLGGIPVPQWTISAVFPGEETARRNYRWHLLQVSFGRRVWLERSLFRLTRKEYGLFSGAMKKHLARRWNSFLHDGVVKAKNPEQTVAGPAGRKA